MYYSIRTDRPLGPGLWPAEECFRDPVPIARDYFLVSHAPRDRFGIYVIDRFGMGNDLVDARDSLYLAHSWTWLAALEDCPQGLIMFCGHNPGFDDLVEYLSAETPPLTADGKLMTTAAIAHLAFHEEWSGVGRGSGQLLSLVRPREL